MQLFVAIFVLIGLWFIGDFTCDGDEWHDPTWHPAYFVFYTGTVIITSVITFISWLHRHNK